MKLIEGPNSHWNRPRRKPLRSLPELAEEFGVSPRALAMAMQNIPGAPLMKVNGRSNVNKVRWFDPDEVRAWWATANYSPDPRGEYHKQWRAKNRNKEAA